MVQRYNVTTAGLGYCEVLEFFFFFNYLLALTAGLQVCKKNFLDIYNTVKNNAAGYMARLEFKTGVNNAHNEHFTWDFGADFQIFV